jgi:hypothetical protein
MAKEIHSQAWDTVSYSFDFIKEQAVTRGNKNTVDFNKTWAC